MESDPELLSSRSLPPSELESEPLSSSLERVRSLPRRSRPETGPCSPRRWSAPGAPAALSGERCEAGCAVTCLRLRWPDAGFLASLGEDEAR